MIRRHLKDDLPGCCKTSSIRTFEIDFVWNQVKCVSRSVVVQCGPQCLPTDLFRGSTCLQHYSSSLLEMWVGDSPHHNLTSCGGFLFRKPNAILCTWPVCFLCFQQPEVVLPVSWPWPASCLLLVPLIFKSEVDSLDLLSGLGIFSAWLSGTVLTQMCSVRFVDLSLWNVNLLWCYQYAFVTFLALSLIPTLWSSSSPSEFW